VICRGEIVATERDILYIKVIDIMTRNSFEKNKVNERSLLGMKDRGSDSSYWWCRRPGIGRGGS
jgi:hypothetical protein